MTKSIFKSVFYSSDRQVIACAYLHLGRFAFGNTRRLAIVMVLEFVRVCLRCYSAVVFNTCFPKFLLSLFFHVLLFSVETYWFFVESSRCLLGFLYFSYALPGVPQIFIGFFLSLNRPSP